jgi:hypothetical protein
MIFPVDDRNRFESLAVNLGDNARCFVQIIIRTGGTSK